MHTPTPRLTNALRKQPLFNITLLDKSHPKQTMQRVCFVISVNVPLYGRLLRPLGKLLSAVNGATPSKNTLISKIKEKKQQQQKRQYVLEKTKFMPAILTVNTTHCGLRLQPNQMQYGRAPLCCFPISAASLFFF